MVNQCDESDISASDYTIFVKNIPIEYQSEFGDYDQDLKEFFSNHLSRTKKFNIASVNLCYNISEFMNI